MKSFKQKKRSSSVDLNTLLQIANGFVYVLIVYLFSIEGQIDRVDGVTIFLASFFAIENIGMLLYEKKRQNPFILLLVFVMTVFYFARIGTILYIPESASRIGATHFNSAAELNFALIFIMLSNASMFLGFLTGRRNGNRPTNIVWRGHHISTMRIAIIIVCCLALDNYFGIINFVTFGLLGSYKSLFINKEILVLFSFTVFVYYYYNTSVKVRFIFIIIVVSITIFISMSGSRSGILSMFIIILISNLSVSQRIRFSKKLMLICFMLIPISMLLFVTSTFKRQIGVTTSTSIQHLYLINEYDLFSVEKVRYHLNTIFYRLGFLDYSTDLIVNDEKYIKIVDSEYYAKSIIDNVLSPGFDIFDIPRASHALTYARNGNAIFHKNEITGYQSDQMGIYGEFYILFYGYPALIAFFLFAFSFQKAYGVFKNANSIRTCLYRAIVLFLFYKYLNSFGIDWFALDVVSVFLTSLLFVRYYIRKKKVVGKLVSPNLYASEYVFK